MHVAHQAAIRVVQDVAMEHPHAGPLVEDHDKTNRPDPLCVNGGQYAPRCRIRSDNEARTCRSVVSLSAGPRNRVAVMTQGRARTDDVRARPCSEVTT